MSAVRNSMYMPNKVLSVLGKIPGIYPTMHAAQKDLGSVQSTFEIYQEVNL